MVYSTFIFGGGRLLGPEQYQPLARPLYEDFLDLKELSLDAITNFMATHVMIGGFGAPESEDPQAFVLAQQRRMKEVMLKASKRTLKEGEILPLFPLHEDGVVDGTKLGQMGAIEILTPELVPVDTWIRAVPGYEKHGREWIPHSEGKVPVQRYYSWLDYMWAEFLDAVIKGRLPPICLDCGRLLQYAKGRPKRYCGPENPECYRPRRASYVRKSRARRRDVT